MSLPTSGLPRLAFGIAPPGTAHETASWAQRAEAAGMSSLWLYDVPGEWPDPYPCMALALQATRSLRVGPLVSTPALRPPGMLSLMAATLQRLSGGRFEVALGRGDAAVRSMGCEPCSVSELEAAAQAMRRPRGPAVRGPWLEGCETPVWLGTYGPLGLRAAGRSADGIVLQLTDVELVRWALELVAQGAREAGRNPSDVRVMVACAVSFAAEQQQRFEATRWFLDLVAPDLVRIGRRRDASSWSARVRASLEAWEREPSASTASGQLDLICLAGTRAVVRTRLQALAAVGVHEVCAYGMGDDEALLEAWSTLA